jgi:hypothetical protein
LGAVSCKESLTRSLLKVVSCERLSLHWNVLKHFIYIKDGSLSHSDMVPGHNHVIVIWFVPSCY